MMVFLSPARKMSPGINAAPAALTRPRFLEKTERLRQILRGFSPWELESLMKISPALAMEAFACYQDGGAREGAALLTYRGLAYRALGAESLSGEDLEFSAECLRLFSAYYGPLRPTDAIRPYRLEMLCRLSADGVSLYRFWGDAFYQDVFAGGGPVINLASQEYAAAVTPYLQARDRLITCRFLTLKRGKAVCLPTAAKMARGAMARFIIKERIVLPEDLKSFAWEGYRFSGAMSSDSDWVFFQQSQ